MRRRFWTWMYHRLWNTCDWIYWNRLRVHGFVPGKYTVAENSNSTCTIEIVNSQVIGSTILGKEKYD